MIITNLTDVDYWFGPMHLAASSGAILNLDDTSDTSLYLLNDEVADAVNTLYLSSNITVTSEAAPFPRATGVPQVLHGDGSPQGLVYAPQGSLYMRRDSVYASTGLYTKTTGVTQNIGWVSALAPGMELIEEITVPAGAGVAEISFSSIPQTYSHLKVVASLGSTESSTDTSLSMIANGFISDVYDSQVLSGQGTTVEAFAYLGATEAFVGVVPPGPYLAGIEITLMGYKNPLVVPFTAVNGFYDGAAGTSGSTLVTGAIGTGDGIAPITSLGFSMPGPNFVAGSVATLYGLVGYIA